MSQAPKNLWSISENGYSAAKTDVLGSKLLIGNGYMGYRGTLEEHEAGALVACTLAGLYDRKGDAWREPVNAPNGLFARVYAGKKLLSPLTQKPVSHSQTLDFSQGLHRRESLLKLPGGGRLRLAAERFASLDDLHLLVQVLSLSADRDCTVTLELGIDAQVWDINGPHFKSVALSQKQGSLLAEARTNEGAKVWVASTAQGLPQGRVRKAGGKILQVATLKLKKGVPVSIVRVASVYTSLDKGASASLAVHVSKAALGRGLRDLCRAHQEAWTARWREADVQIEGDPAGQQALRYSIYHLLAIAPAHTDKASIPARGLSGQVYKGAIFWDTEMFMLPFFNLALPQLARNLVRYRVHTLPGARRKAAGLGHSGAFYAWESQETGDDACTLFNITDVITNRPLRTYFADKQVHISADVALGIWQYYLATGDKTLILQGGAEVLLDCAKFFRSWARTAPGKARYEILDVTGPDEYHERVHNNAFSNGMALATVEAALKAAEVLRRSDAAGYRRLAAKLGFSADLRELKDLAVHLYMPQPDKKTGVIEQFDGYHKLEDCRPADLKPRLLDPREYLGGGQGVATTTQVLKQADVIMLLNVLGTRYSQAVKKANWEFYEPRTEHGSSLSACVYALVAAAVGKTEWAYKYFLKTATVDLRGDAKQYVGSLYIGGTHPAANGGAWMAAVLGFGGLSLGEQGLGVAPRLPKAGKALQYRVAYQGQHLSVRVQGRRVTVTADKKNQRAITFHLGRRRTVLLPGRSAVGAA